MSDSIERWKEQQSEEESIALALRISLERSAEMNAQDRYQSTLTDDDLNINHDLRHHVGPVPSRLAWSHFIDENV